MMEKIIVSYVNKLTKSDIIQFANSNNVSLSNEEVNIIYETIKKDWRDLLYNPNRVFTNLQNKVSADTYKNITYFYNLYSKKLHHLKDFR